MSKVSIVSLAVGEGGHNHINTFLTNDRTESLVKPQVEVGFFRRVPGAEITVGLHGCSPWLRLGKLAMNPNARAKLFNGGELPLDVQEVIVEPPQGGIHFLDFAAGAGNVMPIGGEFLEQGQDRGRPGKPGNDVRDGHKQERRVASLSREALGVEGREWVGVGSRRIAVGPNQLFGLIEAIVRDLVDLVDLEVSEQKSVDAAGEFPDGRKEDRLPVFPDKALRYFTFEGLGMNPGERGSNRLGRG